MLAMIMDEVIFRFNFAMLDNSNVLRTTEDINRKRAGADSRFLKQSAPKVLAAETRENRNYYILARLENTRISDSE
jgi:hypothetical protein